MNKNERIKELVKLCNEASLQYYTYDKPMMSDKDYDKSYDELTELENETEYILCSSPTQKVQGEILSSLKKVKHTEPMLSAEKSKNIFDIIKFMNNQDCILSWKLDGLTLVLRYNDGKFQQAITRGGGLEGEDVTHTVKTFINIPMSIPYKGYLELRGEGLVTFKDFQRINEDLIKDGQDTYSSPRNLSAGSVRQLDSSITKKRNLIFIAFGIVKCDDNISYKHLQLNFLKKQGFDVVEWFDVNSKNIEEVIENIRDKVEKLDYLTDGLIIEYNDIAYGKAQGVTGHHTKNIFALKWNDDYVETIFKGVELNTTRTGMVSITGLFDEVDIDGVKVSRASLHNFDIFNELELGIGDTITVYRANAVIPQVEDNLTRSGKYKINMKCPSCGSDIKIKTPKEAKFLFCENDNCPAKLVQKFTHFVSKDAMSIDGMSEQTVEKLIDMGLLDTFEDIYKLNKYESQIINTDGFGERSYEKLWDAINKSRNVKLENFIYSLGIPTIGRTASKTISKHCSGNFDILVKLIEDWFDWTKLNDFGDTMARSINNYIEEKDKYGDLLNFNQMLRLSQEMNFIQEEKKETNLKDLSDYVFVITGSVITFKNRDEFKELVENLGGKVSGSVSNKTDFLVNNDITSTSGKNKTAMDLGVKIISEAQFNEFIGR